MAGMRFWRASRERSRPPKNIIPQNLTLKSPKCMMRLGDLARILQVMLGAQLASDDRAEAGRAL